MAITTTRRLLTDFWTADVDEAETAMEQIRANRRGKNDCQVAFFEVARDAHLHVNVTHKNRTVTESGWAGPGVVPHGFVHNRTFAATEASRMIRQIRGMVLAPAM